MDFSIGEVVKKQDGVLVTVEGIEGEHLRCVWFEGTELHRDKIPISEVKVVRD